MSKRSEWPQWLQDADAVNANVTIVDGRVHWHGGVWHGGKWHGGEWYGGVWHGGEWHGGEWYDGVWRGGVWHGGVWRGGVWHGGVWHDGKTIDRVLFMAAMCGIVFDETGHAYGYRSVTRDLGGRYTAGWVQPLGEFSEKHDPPGSGTCRRGVHVASAATAWTYFCVDPTARLIRVRFRREQLLDCDGQKARISGGFAEEIPWPWKQEAPR